MQGASTQSTKPGALVARGIAPSHFLPAYLLGRNQVLFFFNVRRTVDGFRCS